MPRTPLGQISSNSTKQKELTPFQRSQIIVKASCRMNPSKIYHNLDIPR